MQLGIAVDGPLHYLQPEQNPNPQTPVAQTEHGDSALSVLPSLPGERRAKDRFIDHMLEQYGYRVFRIPYTYGPESPEFGKIIHQIQASLANSNPEGKDQPNKTYCATAHSSVLEHRAAAQSFCFSGSLNVASLLP